MCAAYDRLESHSAGSATTWGLLRVKKQQLQRLHTAQGKKKKYSTDNKEHVRCHWMPYTTSANYHHRCSIITLGAHNESDLHIVGAVGTVCQA